MRIIILLILTLISITLNAKPFCISHRAITSGSNENSLSTLRNVIDLNSDGVEFDIHHTQDQVAILSHDTTLERTSRSKAGRKCPLQVEISKLSLATIQESCELKSGEEIATLREALQLLEPVDIYTFLEIKDLPSMSTISLIEKYNHQKPNLLRIISFKWKTLKAIKKKKKTSTFWSNVKLIKNYRAIPLSFSSYGINIKYKMRFMSLLPKLLNREISVWKVNSDEELRKVLRKNVDFIVTDNIEKCMQLK